MADDIRTRLSEALDEAELVAATCRADVGPDPEHYPSNIFGFDHAELEFMRAWGPSTVLRLIERDRALAAHYWRVVDSVEEADSMTGRTIRRVMAETLAPEFERLTAFWLGTPEVDR